MSHESQHAAHTQQHSDHAAWLSDCLNWRVDYIRAFATLSRVEAMFMQYDADIAEHELLVRGHERANDVQESLMAKAEQGAEVDASEDADAFLAKVHEQQAVKHAKLRERHLALMARVRELDKALDELG